MKTTRTYGIVACSKTRVRCVFCGVHIPKANRCIEQHTNGAKHKENIQLMSENGISFEDDVLFCRPCNKTITGEDNSVLKHIDGDDHGNFMAALDDLTDGEFITLDQYLACESDCVYCEVCVSDILCSLETIQEHVNGMLHRAKIVERLKPLNGIFPVANNDELWCKVCDEYIENTVQGVLDHIDDDDDHMDWFTKIEDLIENHEVTIESYLMNEHELNAYCNKCEVHILCAELPIQSHVHSDSHLNRFGL
ncbi:uncharacterized protein LOC115455660 [Manduca sexta]|uniref:uncharacterized protein LOC115455660 n=1 Tax=Manduca sexta TaxID=7130 RepID=UPI001183BCC7|nr:uncharacterized protein LOC115455660 [Manduca sexta]